MKNETVGHRSHTDDPLYRCRRLLTRADERLADKGRTKLLGLLDAGDPDGEVRYAWHAKVVRSIYEHHDADLAVAFAERLGQGPAEPVNARGDGLPRADAGPMEGPDRRLAPGPSQRFRNHRIRVLLYAGRPNWDLLATITPC